LIVIAKKVGRLANRLVLFAHFIGSAIEHGFTVLNPSFFPYARYFPSAAGDLLCRFPAGRAVPAPPGSRRLLYRLMLRAADVLYWQQRRGRDVGLIRLRREDRLDLNSEAFLQVVRRHRIVLVQDWFFRNAQNCERHGDVIRSFLTPWPDRLARARAVLDAAHARARFVVGVHVRRGDYLAFKEGRFYYSHDQYRRLMEGIEAVYADRDVSFLVCSDEPLPPFAFRGLDIVRGTGGELEDLYSFAACDALVGPPSTYTHWASYYGGVPLYHVQDPEAAPQLNDFRVRRGLD
jgi:hypothetical protein